MANDGAMMSVKEDRLVIDGERGMTEALGGGGGGLRC
jgi:hypothetical protein